MAKAEGFVLDVEESVVWFWRPDASEIVDDVGRCYVVTTCPKATSGGIILYAKHGNKWQANPWTSRPVIARLLGLMGGSEVRAND